MEEIKTVLTDAVVKIRGEGYTAPSHTTLYSLHWLMLHVLMVSEQLIIIGVNGSD